MLFNVLTLIIIAMSVGSLAALSAYPFAYYCFVVPAMLPMIWRYLNMDELSLVVFGSLLFVFNIALFSILRVNHRILKDSIFLRYENIDLIEQLTEQKEKAEYANASKTKFLAAASHDIRQPLHAIGLFLGVLEERVKNIEQKNIVQKIKKSSEALNILLDSLLDISKLDAGVIQVDSNMFCINNLFEVLKNEFQGSANEKNITLKFVQTYYCINSDYQIIERILRNFIANAIRYTDHGGVLVACRRYQGKILLAIYDTGIGIHEDDLQNIFTEFHQLHNPQRDSSHGLGLGLAIVTRMAELLRLPLYVKTRLGKGSVFGLVIPAVDVELAVKISSTTISRSSLFSGRSILLVDDNASIRESLSALLKSWNVNVVVAASGNEAVERLKHSRDSPDLMLVDYRLANHETGIDVIQKVECLYPNKTIYSIIITGDTAPDRIKEVEKSAYKTLHKPVSPDELKLLLAEQFASNN